jgi:hypothetical protein
VSVAVSGLACTRNTRQAARKHQVDGDMPTPGRTREDASVPAPESGEERVVEHQRLIDYVAGKYAPGRHAGWQVRVELPSHRQTVELARRLRAEGRRVVRRWKYVMLGAANQDEAMALAGAIARQALADPSVSTQANAFVRFPRSQPLIAEIPFYLGG